MQKLLAIGIILLFVGGSAMSGFRTNFSPQQLTRGWLYVGGNGPGNYTRIQDAINASSNGDNVFVFNGTYLGHININKSINLIGEDKNTTYIIGFFADTLAITANLVDISGFTIQYDGRFGEGVKIDSSYNCVHNNIIDMPRERVRLFGNNNTFSANTLIGAYLHLIGDNNTIADNTITNKYYGIYFTSSCGNIIINNSFTNSGLFISDNIFLNNIITNNTVNGKPLIYIDDESNVVIDSDAGQIILVNSTNIAVQNQKISNTTVGIQIWESTSCVITGNTITGNQYGIYLTGWNNTINKNTITHNNETGIVVSEKNNNTIAENTISHNNGNGIYLSYSDHNNLFKNTITYNHYGIMLDDNSDFNNIDANTILNNSGAIRISGDYFNTIADNIIVNNSEGVTLVSSGYTTMINNTITNNNYGIRFESSYHNNIYHNNLINNTKNAYDPFKNTWYNANLEEGNYWSDYTGKDDNNDGIGDTPYNISGGSNKDLYPFIEPNGWVIEPPIIFTIVGGFGVNLKITNNGTADITGIPWQIHVEGGILKRINKTVSGTVDIAANWTKSVGTGMFLDFGPLSISVKVADEQQTTTGTQIFILSMVKK